jgi:hypothetical protein
LTGEGGNIALYWSGMGCTSTTLERNWLVGTNRWCFCT